MGSEMCIRDRSYETGYSDTTLDASYGRFFFGDRGVRLGVTRRFNDLAVQTWLKGTDSDNIAGGIRLTTTLGPRKGYQKGRLTLNGPHRWQHQLQTTIRDPVVRGSNRLQFGMLLAPVNGSDLSTDILDSGRLSWTYLSANTDRLLVALR